MSSADYVAKYPRRRVLREKVERYWSEDPWKPSGSLDSSLKKHTTLLNRLKLSLSVGPAENLIKEIDALTLTKYVEEIVAAVVEGASKARADPEAVVDVVVHLHTRLTPDFLTLLLPQLVGILAPVPAASKDVADKDREKEDKERLARQRPVLRILAELAMVGAWAEGIVKGVGEIGKVLKGMMTNDAQYNNLPLIATFLKHFNHAYLGAQARSPPDGGIRRNGIEDGTRHSMALLDDVEEFVPENTQKGIRDVIVGYFTSASKTLVRGQMKLLEQDKRNHEAYINSGEIFEDRQHAYERMTRAVERMTTGVQNLADLLGLPAPLLPTAASLSKSGLQIVESTSSFTVRDDGPIPGGIWDDEEERRFYEDLVDLKEVVPTGLLGIKDKRIISQTEATKASVTEESEQDEKIAQDNSTILEGQKRDEEDIRRQLEQLELEHPKLDEANDMARTASNTTVGSLEPQATVGLPDEDLSVGPSPLGLDHPSNEEDELPAAPAARLTALFAALPEASNREMVDKLAVEFAFLNSKAARNRLVKFLAAVPKTRTDLLPHYARLVATLDTYMPDVSSGLIEALDEDLRYLQRKKNVRELDGMRLKNVRFYGELAKFKVAKPYTILHVLKVFLDDFRPNIENIANLLETSGRFLLRYEGTAETAKSMVELMRRKQGTQHLDARYHIMLENAFYQCNPPERTVREIIELTPMQSFIQHLLHDVLMKRTLDKVLKLIRKLHWDNEEVYAYILNSFSEIWEVKFGNIPFIAALVYDLQRYHADFAIAVVDQVMEEIRIGMEENIFKFNQRRIATVKYLGELFMYRVVNASVIFDTLWGLISFGHGEGLPVPGRDSPIDSIDDFFRIRLVCTLLETCGACFDRGSQRRKLDHFLVVFQLYVTCKGEMPIDVDFMLGDTLEMLRPDGRRLKTFSEAASAVDELLAHQADARNDSDAEDGSEEDIERAIADAEAEEEDEVPATMAVSEGDDDQDDVFLIRDPKHEEVDTEAQADFDRDFAKMLADTTDARRGERKNAPPIFDTAVPLVRKKPEEADGGLGKMAFTLLSKRGNKQQMRSVDIPVDSAIAVNSRTYQLRNKAEQEQLKRLILQNERRQGQNEMQAIEEDARARGIRLRYVPS